MRINYDSYQLSFKEWILFIIEGLLIDAMVSYLFYRNIIAFIVFLPAIAVFISREKKILCSNRKKELALQFKEGIMAVSASLNAGYSIENSFKEALKDLLVLYSSDAIIVKEFRAICGRLSSNETLESILQDLADRSGVDDIQDFTDVFITAKRSGGDMVSIIRKTVEHIGDKIEVKREIDTLMSAKKMEQNIMSFIPFIIIFYLDLSSSGFLNTLYGNLIGIIIMTVCLLLYLVAYFMAQKIVNIEV